jgi:hypothetical protein
MAVRRLRPHVDGRDCFTYEVRSSLIGSKAKDLHEAGILLLIVWSPSDVCPPEDAQHHEAAEPVLTGFAGPVWIPVEALGGVVVVALAVTPVGEWDGAVAQAAPQAEDAVAALAEALAGIGAGPGDSVVAQGGAVVERVVAALDEPAAVAVGRVEFRVEQVGLAAERVCSPAELVSSAADRVESRVDLVLLQADQGGLVESAAGYLARLAVLPVDRGG